MNWPLGEKARKRRAERREARLLRHLCGLLHLTPQDAGEFLDWQYERLRERSEQTTCA